MRSHEKCSEAYGVGEANQKVPLLLKCFLLMTFLADFQNCFMLCLKFLKMILIQIVYPCFVSFV